MSKMEAPPFERGEVFTQYSDDQTESATGGAQYEGMEFEFEDKDYSGRIGGGVTPDRTNSQVRVRICRNSSGGVLLGKTFAKNKVDGTDPVQNHGRVAGNATAVTDITMGIVDDHLGPNGVPDGALFYVVIKGPAKLTSGAAGDTNISVGDAVIPTTGGKGIGGVQTAAGNAAGDITAALALALNCRCRALTAVNAINTDFMVMLTSPPL
jgi:hypothetical protein